MSRLYFEGGGATTAHEYLFLLAKAERYYYDAVAVREPLQSGPSDLRKIAEGLDRLGGKTLVDSDPLNKANAATNIGQKRAAGSLAGRNRRSVWEIATRPYSGAHFATFPTSLVEPCVLAGTSYRGCCPECGTPWERVKVKGEPTGGRGSGNVERKIATGDERSRLDTHMGSSIPWEPAETLTTGWAPVCNHYDARYRGEFQKARSSRKRLQRLMSGDWWRRVRQRPGRDTWPVTPCVVLDPFLGSGTTALVALQHGRSAVGIDLNAEYLDLAVKRLAGVVNGRQIEMFEAVR